MDENKMNKLIKSMCLGDPVIHNYPSLSAMKFSYVDLLYKNIYKDGEILTEKLERGDPIYENDMSEDITLAFIVAGNALNYLTNKIIDGKYDKRFKVKK